MCPKEELAGPWDAPVTTFMAGPAHLLWALVLALPEELAAALQADPHLRSASEPGPREGWAWRLMRVLWRC